MTDEQARNAIEALERLARLSERLAVDADGRVLFRPTSPDDKMPRYVAVIATDGRMQVLASGETKRSTRRLATEELRRLNMPTLDILDSTLYPCAVDGTSDADLYSKEEARSVVSTMTPEQVAFVGFISDRVHVETLQRLHREVDQVAKAWAQVGRAQDRLDLPAATFPPWAIVRVLENNHVHYVSFPSTIAEGEKQLRSPAGHQWKLIGLSIGKSMEALLRQCDECSYEPKLLEHIAQRMREAEAISRSSEEAV